MARLIDRIREAVAEDRFTLSDHADDRLRERRIPLWQVVAGLDDARLTQERPQDRPNPSVVVQQTLPDGTPIVTIWAWLPYNRRAKLVTVYFKSGLQ